MTMRLTSTAFEDQGAIPVRYSCDGSDMSPPLAWQGAPIGTRSFALVCVDPDAPSGAWYHWAVYNVPNHVSNLPEHYPTDGGVSSQAQNDFHRKGYGGPCPPRGHGMHHYHFKLFALDVDQLPLPAAAPRCREVEIMAQSHAIATAELVGTYSR